MLKRLSMKKNLINRFIAALFLVAIIIAACTKEEADVRLDPKLSTSNILNLKSDSATVVGFVIAQGGGFSEKGVCYNTEPNPTISNNKVQFTGTTDKATFNVPIGGLAYATKYYARAFATGASGTVYGEEITFTTLPVVPTVVTGAFTANTGTTASGGGNVNNNGGANVTARGVVYGTSHNPTLTDSKTTDGNGMCAFTSSLSNLQGLTTYYVRAYATNSAGTGYGPEVTFTTPQSIVTLWVAGDFQGWSPQTAKDSLMNSDTDPIVQGYVNITNTNGFKFVSQKNWDGTNYGIGASAGTLSTTGGDITASSPGYYLMKINLDALTYTATKTTWGVIGDATADQWNSDQNMTYSTVLRKWVATIPLTAAKIKFRANDAWDINYGDDGNNGSLEPGGADIPVATAGTYSVILDLSSPLKYKYSVTQWGIIGDATAGGCDSDTNMTPNANNKWTITANLSVGKIKFRANDAWDINYGGSDGNIVAGGADISIPAAGTYTITLDLVNGTYTIQ